MENQPIPTKYWTDPGERYNLIETKPEVARRMKTTLREWKASCAASDRGDDYRG